MRTLLTTLVLALLAAQAPSQNIVYYDDNDPTTGRANAFPFGSETTRVQVLIPHAVLGSTAALIQDLHVACAPGNPAYTESEVAYADIEIRAGLTSLTTLTTSWSTNLPIPVTVYRGPLRVKFVVDQWVPLGLPVPIPWAPTSSADNLVVDITIWDVADTGSVTPGASGYFMWSHSSAAGAINRAFLRGWTVSTSSPARVDSSGIKLGFLLNDGSFVAHGGGCAGSSGLPPRIGTPAGVRPQINGGLVVELHDGPANSGAFLSIGTDIRSLGSVPLPIDLAPIGAPGCSLWHDALVTTGSLLVDPTGHAVFTIGIPNSSGLLGARLFTTWICLDPGANGLNFTTSGYATAMIGT